MENSKSNSKKLSEIMLTITNYPNDKSFSFNRNNNENKFVTLNKNKALIKKQDIFKKNIYSFNYFLIHLIIFLLPQKINLVVDEHFIILTFLNPTDANDKLYTTDLSDISDIFDNNGIFDQNNIFSKNDIIGEIDSFDDNDNKFNQISEFNNCKIINITEQIFTDILYDNSKVFKQKLTCNNVISNFSFMFNNFWNLGEIYFNNIFDKSVNMTYTFNNCYNLKNITFINNGNCKLIGSKGMFYNCKSLNILNLTYFEHITGEDISYMFFNCQKLNNLIFNRKIKCLAKNMRGLFQNCISLESLNISQLSSTGVEITWEMFKNCQSLNSIDLSSFDTSKVTDMQSMFEGCSSLNSLDLSNFNTSNVQYMNEMFLNCINLKSIDFRNINTDSLSTMYRMFYGCSNLEYLNLYSLKEDGQSIYEMFEGVSSTFKFCIKENENIPNIFEKLKDISGTIRDCSESCYGEGKGRDATLKKLCCSKFIFKEDCFDKCPARTIASPNNKQCENFSCTYFYNYEQNGCIESDKIPEGFFVNDSILKTIDKCHEDCKACYKKENEDTKNCLICQDSNTFLYSGNCLSECPVDFVKYYDAETQRFICTSSKDKCLKYSEESLLLDLCISCNEGYYPKYNDLIIDSNFIACYKDPEGYYLDSDKKYRPCYFSCKYCIKEGNDKKQFCTSCKEYYSIFLINVNNEEIFNCYPDCKHNYYFDEEGNYNCIEEPGCPIDRPFIINGTRECVESCDSTPNKIEFLNKCFKSCPSDSFKNDEGFCQLNCSFEKPFELVNEEICVSTCTIMERYYNFCITNYKKDRMDEIHDLIVSDIQFDLIDSFDYTFLEKENKSIIIVENNTLFEIISTNITTKNKLISRIDLGECESYLKENYNIDDKESLYIFKIDKKEEDTLGSLVNYEIYYPVFGSKHLRNLDISKCESTKIKILIPMNLSSDNLDIYDKESPFYSDICYTYTSDDGTDMILDDRKLEYDARYKNICQENCDFETYHTEENLVQCSCSLEINIPSESSTKIEKDNLFNFMDINSIFNINVMKCPQVFFSIEGIKMNFGFYFFIPIIVMYFICISIFYIKDLKIIKTKFKRMMLEKNNLDGNNLNKKSIFLSFIDKKKIRMASRNELNKNSIIETNNDAIREKMLKIKYKNISESVKSLIKTFNLNSKGKKSIKGKKKDSVKNILDYIDEELNEMNFSKALKYDQRTFFQYYFNKNI